LPRVMGPGGPIDEKPFKSPFQKLEWAFLLWGAKARFF
jgi:hypothetical protein